MTNPTYPNFTIIPNAGSDGNGGGDGEQPLAATKSRPQRALPTPRVKVSIQLDLLRAYAITSNYGGGATSYIKAANLTKISPGSASICNAFFYDLGLLSKAAEGGVLPNQLVIEYARARDWNRDDAAIKLAPAIRNSWFARIVTMHLQMRQIPVSEAVRLLAEEASAGPDHQAALRMCIEYMELAGVVRRIGDHLQLAGPSATAETIPPVESPPTEEEEMAADPLVKERAARPAPASGFLQSSGGSVRLAFDVTVSMAEMATWDAARIAAFFNGIAAVLAAKRGMEE